MGKQIKKYDELVTLTSTGYKYHHHNTQAITILDVQYRHTYVQQTTITGLKQRPKNNYPPHFLIKIHTTQGTVLNSTIP